MFYVLCLERVIQFLEMRFKFGRLIWVECVDGCRAGLAGD
jgi:hypothetical protein